MGGPLRHLQWAFGVQRSALVGSVMQESWVVHQPVIRINDDGSHGTAYLYGEKRSEFQNPVLQFLERAGQ